MELNDRIIVDVTHVKHTTFAQYFGMFMHHKPANVRKEESPIWIVRIGIGFREFVMHPMIADPFINGILARQCKAQHQYDSQWCFRFVRSMSPETMGATRYTETTKTTRYETCVLRTRKRDEKCSWINIKQQTFFTIYEK